MLLALLSAYLLRGRRGEVRLVPMRPLVAPPTFAERGPRTGAPVSPFRVVRVAAAIAVASTTAACGGASGDLRPDRPLPPYGGHAAELFDDAIEPNAVGYPMEAGSSPLSDNRVRERTQIGDAVVRARVTTVTSKVEDRGRSWQLGFHTMERLAGSGPLEKDFTLTVASTDPASGIVHGFEARLIGTLVVAFVREFARPGAPPGEPGDIRFHLAADSADEQKAVKAAQLEEVR
jgi:hypothetical protein